MITKVHRNHLAALLLLILASASWNVFAGSEASRKTTTESSLQLSGQELWSMNCQRCHNMRSPTMYSDAQWDVIVHHMRVRANITGAEQRAIADFLKSGSH